jgi:hypothetical protein
MNKELNNWNLAVTESERLKGGLSAKDKSIGTLNWLLKKIIDEKEKTKIPVNSILDFSYEKMIPEILELDLSKTPNERNTYFYKYLKKIIKINLIKWVKWVNKWRKTKYIKKEWEFWEYRWVDQDWLEKNQQHVQNYLSIDGDLNENYYEKFDLYYGIYETVILERIQNQLLNIDGNIEEEDLKNIIRNVVNQFLYMLYAFWSKLSVDKFSSLFLKTKTVNSNNPADVEWVISLCKQAVTIINKLSPEQEEWEIQLTKKELQVHNDLLDVYKHFIPSGIINVDGDTFFDASLISIKLSKHLEEVMLNIADIFKHWYYSHNENKDELIQIIWLLEHFELSINYLKETDIAFSEIDIHHIIHAIQDSENNVWMGIVKILNIDNEIESFKKLLEIKKGLKKGDEKTYNRRIDKICNDIKISKKYSTQKLVFWEPNESEEIDFHIYNNYGPDNRKMYFIENVYQLDEEHRIQWLDITSLESNKYRTDMFYKYYCIANDKCNLTEETVKADLDQAFKITKSWMHILDFEKKHINLEQILVTWFRYNMILDTNDNLDTNLFVNYEDWNSNENIIREIHNMDKNLLWAKEKILSNTSADVLDNMKMEFSWHLKNWSISDIDKLIQDHMDLFKNSSINLNDKENYWYKNEKWKTILFKDHSKLFINNNIPDELKEENQSIEMSETEIDANNNKLFNLRENHIKHLIELTNLLLQRRSPEELKKSIFKDENWWDITIDDHWYNHVMNSLEELWIESSDYRSLYKLKNFLEYTLKSFVFADKLHKNSIKSHSKIQNIVQVFENNLVTDKNQTFELWNPKSFNRIFQKLIWSYAGDTREMRDLVRCRYVASDLDDSYEKFTNVLELINSDPTLQYEIKQWLIDDNCWNHSEKAEKATWYRDLSIELKTIDWEVIEFQFITNEIFQWKHYGLTQKELLSIYQEKRVTLDDDFIEELENRCKAENIDMLDFMRILNPKSNVAWIIWWNTEKKFNSDDLYRLWRWSVNKDFKEKIQYMEWLVYDMKWWEVIANQTKNKFLPRLKTAA